MFGSLLLACLFLHLVVSVPQPACRRCCDHLPAPDEAATLSESMPAMPEVRTYINMTILKVGRRKSLHSIDNYQALIFDTIFVNSPEHFDMFAGKYRCQIPGIYFFNVNIHTWNFKETYLHIMQNDSEKAIVYAQPSDRSIMQSQSVMLPLQEGDEVWVRLYKRERENAIYSDDVDIYITFNGYLIKAETE
uniref:C1q domain-containing protein n=1 Tax=Sinocyclocheilus grahami TaxID=75366 RepID=A0A672T653_SINGR